MNHFLAICMAVALAANAGCTVIPRADPAAEEVFRNAAGEPVEVPFDWAGQLKGSEVERLKSSEPFNPSTFQPFNSREGRSP